MLSFALLKFLGLKTFFTCLTGKSVVQLAYRAIGFKPIAFFCISDLQVKKRSFAVCNPLSLVNFGQFNNTFCGFRFRQKASRVLIGVFLWKQF